MKIKKGDSQTVLQLPYELHSNVFVTKDLTIFKLIKGNRPPNIQHIKRLTDSIELNGVLCSPILVNERMEVIDGQHRLAASTALKKEVYFIIVKGYDIKQVHTLNLNQKNWTNQDFLTGYADMGLTNYLKLREFQEKFSDFKLADLIMFCNNNATQTNYAYEKLYGGTKVFKEGTWEITDITKAETYAISLLSIKPLYEGYNRSSFVGAMVTTLQKKEFSLKEFLDKLRLQPTALKDCANRTQYRELIEFIYNYRRRKKINLRY